MPNCIIYKENKIYHFIKDCVVSKRDNQKNKDYVGSNRKLYSFKDDDFQIKWIKENLTEDFKEIEIEDRIIKKPLGFKETPDDLTEVDFIGEIPVDSDEEIEAAIKVTILKTYSLEDEIKLLRRKIIGTLSDEEWDEYIETVEDLVVEGKRIKVKIKE